LHEDLCFSLVDQRVGDYHDEAARERLLHLEPETNERRRGVSARVRLGRGLIGLGGRIAGVQVESRPTGRARRIA
jgi:hypothetical protein